MKAFKINREGKGIIILLFIVFIVAFFVIKWLSLLFLVLALFSLYFFRDPERNIPDCKNRIVSPADGTVLKIETQVEEPLFFQRKVNRISIFMSLFDVHVNRAPIAGKIVFVKYNPGKFFNASLDKASKYNESNFSVIEGENFVVGVKQISGVIARRIVFFKDVGDEVQCGERLGVIKFGSRVELYYEGDVKFMIKAGDKVKAGETIIGERT